MPVNEALEISYNCLVRLSNDPISTITVSIITLNLQTLDVDSLGLSDIVIGQNLCSTMRNNHYRLLPQIHQSEIILWLKFT
ncbi:hypothetical protein HZS_190 [Henneguya salminicola]|nr:hypothetical protein HZS_190 [Henneguya salminicola]